MHIETERLLIRWLEASDLEALVALWTDPDVTRYMGGPRDPITLRNNIEESLNTEPATIDDLWPTIEKSTRQVIGHCGLLKKEVDNMPEVEIVYVFARNAWGQGYASEAAAALRDYAFEQLGLNRLIALIDPENAASAGVAMKIGMKFEKESIRPGDKHMRVYVINAS